MDTSIILKPSNTTIKKAKEIWKSKRVDQAVSTLNYFSLGTVLSEFLYDYDNVEDRELFIFIINRTLGFEYVKITDDGRIEEMWIAKDKNGDLFLYNTLPKKVKDCYITRSGSSICIDSGAFPMVTWEGRGTNWKCNIVSKKVS